MVLILEKFKFKEEKLEKDKTEKDKMSNSQLKLLSNKLQKILTNKYHNKKNEPQMVRNARNKTDYRYVRIASSQQNN